MDTLYGSSFAEALSNVEPPPCTTPYVCKMFDDCKKAYTPCKRFREYVAVGRWRDDSPIGGIRHRHGGYDHQKGERKCRHCGITYTGIEENFSSRHSRTCKSCAKRRNGSTRSNARTCVKCGETKFGIAKHFGKASGGRVIHTCKVCRGVYSARIIAQASKEGGV